MTTRDVFLPSDYSRTLEEIKTCVRTAQYEALKAVNRELIALYWDIGRIIVARQQDHGWAGRWWSGWRPICDGNFQGSRVFRPETSGT